MIMSLSRCTYIHFKDNQLNKEMCVELYISIALRAKEEYCELSFLYYISMKVIRNYFSN